MNYCSNVQKFSPLLEIIIVKVQTFNMRAYVTKSSLEISWSGRWTEVRIHYPLFMFEHIRAFKGI